jgi:hypothetical protein
MCIYEIKNKFSEFTSPGSISEMNQGREQKLFSITGVEYCIFKI